MANYEDAKSVWQRQVGVREELPWTRGAVMLQLQPLVFLGAAITGGVQGYVGVWITAAIIVGYGYALCWIDTLQLPPDLKAPAGETVVSAIIPFAYLGRRGHRLSAAGVPRGRLPFWVYVGVWAAAAIVWLVLWSVTGIGWAISPWG